MTLAKHKQMCPYCDDYIKDECAVCNGLGIITWEWDDEKTEEEEVCYFCEELREVVMELPDKVVRTYACRDCLVKEHDEMCGCDKWN